jgi:hypothetical protein
MIGWLRRRFDRWFEAQVMRAIANARRRRGLS